MTAVQSRHGVRRLWLWLLRLLPLFALECSGLCAHSTGSGGLSQPSRPSTALRSSPTGAAPAPKPKPRRPPRPIDPGGWPEKFPAKSHCSKCGLCETSYVTHVKDACAFLGEGMKRNIDGLEATVHGRARRLDDMVWADGADGKEATAEEARFGVLQRPMTLARGRRIADAQWTGCVTGIAVSMLEAGLVDAVVCIASQEDGGADEAGGWSTPEPILARTVDEVLRGRGVKPALAPSLRVLDELRDSPEIKKLLFCGVGCAVQAFRAIQHTLPLDAVYVLGTNCADNSPTPEDAREFLRRSVPEVDAKRIKGYEFMQDFRVHVKYDAGGGAASPAYERKPYFCLPGDVAEFAIADSCLACFDYTNALADVVVGYMAAPLDNNAQMDQAFQTITVRNARGEEMMQSAIAAGRLELGPTAQGVGAHEKFALATVSADNLVVKMAGGKMKEQGMPRFLGEIMASGMTAVGPKGVSFARYSLDYHLLRNYLHLIDVWGEDRARAMLPKYGAAIVDKYLDTHESFEKLAEAVKAERS